MDSANEHFTHFHFALKKHKLRMNFSMSPTDFHTFLKYTFAFVKKVQNFVADCGKYFSKMDDCQHSMTIKSNIFT